MFFLYRLALIIIFIISTLIVAYLLTLPINVIPILLIAFSYSAILVLFLEAITYKFEIDDKFIIFKSIFYKKRFEISKIESFQISFFCVKIRSEGKKYTFLPLGGWVRKVEERLRK